MNIYAQVRSSVRKAIAVDCKVLRTRDLRMVGTRTLDLSPEGMLVPSYESLVLREPVLVSFRLPGLSRLFTTEASVARIIRGRRPRDSGHCFGLEFHSLDGLSRMLVRNSLRRVPPPLPSRAKRVDYAAMIRGIDVGLW